MDVITKLKNIRKSRPSRIKELKNQRDFKNSIRQRGVIPKAATNDTVECGLTFKAKGIKRH